MENILIRVDSNEKAVLLKEMLRELSFVIDIQSIDTETEISVEEEHQMQRQHVLKKKNKRFLKHL